MFGREETYSPRPRNPAEADRETHTDQPGLRDLGDTTVEMQASARPSSPRGVASYQEFADALVEVGLIGAADVKRFTADSAEGVLGLSRALVKAGWLTSYQAAAVYQKKSRGLLVGNYLILDKLGRGGMGMVFRARHRTLYRVGALKILPPSFTRNRAAVMRFRREFEAASQLRHFNLVSAFEADEDRGVHFLVMDYVQGITLDRVVEENGPLPVAEAVDYLIQAARGLEAAHEKGIIHRDIKPGNLILDRKGTVRVLDLGLARIVNAGDAFDSNIDGRLTQTGMYMGTSDYMAPEQAEDSRSVDHRADIYSLGCTFYFLLTGREPFPAPTLMRRMLAHQEQPAPSLRAIRPDVSPALEAAYQEMMAKRPVDRPASMREVIARLHASKPSNDDIGPAVPPPGPSLAQADTSQWPLEGGSPPRTTIDSSIFARLTEDERRPSDRELNLRDLVMDVRSDVHGTGATGAERDENEVTCDDHGLSLRELARELEEEAPRAPAPKPPCAPQPPKRPPGPLQEATPQAAPRPSAAEVQPPKRAAALWLPGTLPTASDSPAAERQPLIPAPAPRPEDAPPTATKPPAARRQSLTQAASMRAGDSAPIKELAILAVVTVILLAVAVIVSVASRPTVAERNGSSEPARDSVESERRSNEEPAPPVQLEP